MRDRSNTLRIRRLRSGSGYARRASDIAASSSFLALAPCRVAGCRTVAGLGHAPWGDKRTGRWVFVGQATVAKSDRWSVKAGDVSVAQWRDLVEEKVPLNGFLAVPHHIQDDHWSHLLLSERLLLDRLRLTTWIGPLTEDEKQFAAASTDIEV